MSANMNTPCGAGREPHQWREEYYGDRCAGCGLLYPHGCAPWDEGGEGDDDWDDNEPTGSCDNCDSNLYRDDDYDGLCSQCAWWAEQAEEGP